VLKSREWTLVAFKNLLTYHKITEDQACLIDVQEPMRFILVLRITFELLQDPMRFILVLRITISFQRGAYCNMYTLFHDVFPVPVT